MGHIDLYSCNTLIKAPKSVRVNFLSVCHSIWIKREAKVFCSAIIKFLKTHSPCGFSTTAMLNLTREGLGLITKSFKSRHSLPKRSQVTHVHNLECSANVTICRVYMGNMKCRKNRLILVTATKINKINLLLLHLVSLCRFEAHITNNIT